jgi:hypothetical protein
MDGMGEKNSDLVSGAAADFACWLVRHTAGVPQLCIAQDPAADELLSRDPLALLLGMLLDQHMRQRSSGTPRG